MAFLFVVPQGLSTPPVVDEKPLNLEETRNPVLESAEYAYQKTNLLSINEDGVKQAAKYILRKVLVESYSPRTWRTQPLHICPSEPYNASDPLTKSFLNWIFLISSLNFSFWSEKEGLPERYGVEWKTSWESEETTVWTGYWSLVASLNRALEDDIPITDPNFYSSETLCPDSLIEHIFRPAGQSTEKIPLLQERISVMREVGFILCNSFEGSFQGFQREFQRRHDGEGTALDLVKMVTETFPCFRDEVYFEGRKVCFWKRAQILVAEMWAAFYPKSTSTPHPLFPGRRGADIGQLTMFADYRVPQILHHLRILTYTPTLIRKLVAKTPFPPGSADELSLRAASIVAVERVRTEILRLIREEEGGDSENVVESGVVSSVLIDFYLWDLAQKVERGEEKVEGLQTSDVVPIHRTRSIWY